MLASPAEEVLEEAADLQEVLLAHLRLRGLSSEDLERARATGEAELGGFRAGVGLEAW